MRKFFILISLLSIAFVQSQELNCKVTVNSDKVASTNNQIFKNLEKSLNDFMNKTTWTEKAFKPNEKILCSVFITINGADNNQFEASIQVQSSRTIFNSSYSSPVLNINDKDFNFSYIEFENITYNPNSYDSNLISVMSYYAYMILGSDAETFEPDSGTPYFVIAQDIVNLALPGGAKGWAQTEKKQNRYYLVNDILSPTFKPYRDAMFSYHFNGLDEMTNDLKSSKEAIINSINTLSELNSNRPNAFLTRVFFDAKADEIVSIFSGGPSIPLTDLLDKLGRISPTNSMKWSQIKL
ncbi:MAG: DUF4835 family protein [Bacteroidota bacterium]